MAKSNVPNPFEITGAAPSREKKPTFNQYVKELPKDENHKHLFKIELIWFPNKWNNYNIETESFRYSVAESHPLYPAIDKNVIRWLDRDTGILFRIDDFREGIVGFSECSDFTRWERIGNAGIRCDWT